MHEDSSESVVYVVVRGIADEAMLDDQTKRVNVENSACQLV